MADIVNLRQARKRAARAERERLAEASRALHGLPSRQRKAEARQNEADRRRHEAHRLEPTPDTGPDIGPEIGLEPAARGGNDTEPC